MIKDRGQKKLAARHCAVQGMVPFVEVVVRSSVSMEEAPLNITDIDVLGVEIGPFGRVRRVLFDCKTAKGQSAINRALWASGLRHLVEAEMGFLIQTKSVPGTHRLAASAMGINIQTEDTFRRYAASMSPDFLKDSTYLDDMDHWDLLLAAGGSNAALSEIVAFVTTQAALEQPGPKGIRAGLSALMRAAGELDPGKPLHHVIFGCAVSGFLIHAAASVAALKDVFDFGMSRAEFEQRLRYFLWEGRENYEVRQKLRRALYEKFGSGSEQANGDFDLPEWGKLLELMRGYLEAPEALGTLPLVAKEIAFRADAGEPKSDADKRISDLLVSNNRARQFIFAASSYLVQAARLPRDFHKSLELSVNFMHR